MPKRKHSRKQGKSRKRYKSAGSSWLSSDSGYSSRESKRFGTGFRPQVRNWGSNQPDILRIKIRTNVSVSLTCVGGAVSSNAVKANSLHQPFFNIGSITHQNPTGGNLAPLYQRYRVLSAKIILKCYPGLSSTTPQGAFLAVMPIDPVVNTWSSNVYNEYIEAARGHYKYLPMTNAANGYKTVSSAVAMHALVGRSKEAFLGDNHFEGTVTSSATFTDPANVLQFVFMYQSADAATGTQHFCDLLLDQWVEFSSRAPYG